jgi:hypothetical protein
MQAKGARIKAGERLRARIDEMEKRHRPDFQISLYCVFLVHFSNVYKHSDDINTWIFCMASLNCRPTSDWNCPWGTNDSY